MKLNIGDQLTLDLSKLIDSRMLINANSGGGKSYLLRLIAEQAAGHVQIIILDPEGEFATLREKFDFLLVGSGGEIPTEVRSAALLARKLLELQASAVVDLYDLKLPDRRRFVRLFLESLMHLPKSSWRPLLVMLDEAHIFCPERSAGEAESTQAVIDLMSQGRKRSYCGILATQRLSKLHKDAEAETNNVFVGRTWLDIDQERAGKLLGFGKDRRGMRDLEPGNFYAFGPALSANGVVQFQTHRVQTSHPKAGQRHKLTPPKPSDAVRRIVADLADLPQQAEAEIRDLDGAKKRIRELESQLKARPKDTKIEIKETIKEVPVLKNGQLDRVEKILARAGEITGKLGTETAKLHSLIAPAFAPSIPKSTPKAVNPPKQIQPVRRSIPQSTDSASKLPIGERKTLCALIQYPNGLTRRQLTTLTGYKRSTRDAYIQRLRERGFVDVSGEFILATQTGLDALPDAEPLPTGQALQDYWLSRLPQGERSVMEQLIHNYPQAVDRETLTEATGYKRSTRDAYLQRLSAKELVEESGRGMVKASATLFD